MMIRPLISRLRESNLTPIALAFVSLATGIVGLAFAALAIFEPETAKKFDFSIFSFIYDSVLFKTVMAGLWVVLAVMYLAFSAIMFWRSVQLHRKADDLTVKVKLNGNEVSIDLSEPGSIARQVGRLKNRTKNNPTSTC